jgi:uncharacterized phiE125 gp8 family phage protein
MPSILITPPAIEPVSLVEAKAHLRAVHAEEDQLIGTLISSARRIVEARSGLLLIQQTWTCYYDDWPDNGIIDLSLAPVTTVNSLTVFSDDDIPASIDPAHFYADTASRPPRLLLRGSRVWARPGRIANGIAIAVTAGFGAAASAVPEPLCQAILILVAHWFEHRGNNNPPPLPLTLDALISPWREVRL